MSTIFKLFGSNSSVNDEVNRIVNLENSFLKVCVLYCTWFLSKAENIAQWNFLICLSEHFVGHIECVKRSQTQ